jgi:hypothetical protein
MTSSKERAFDEGASASANGHDPSVCGDHCVHELSTTSDALNDELHDRPW